MNKDVMKTLVLLLLLLIGLFILGMQIVIEINGL